MPKVSIIVPVYNVERYLKKTVNSFIEQTLQDIEVILVDDGSPDGSPAICDSFAKEDSRIKVIHKKNDGVSAARNDGLKSATGEYVIFCDSDDWMDKKACEMLYNAAIESDADIVIGDVYMAYENSNKAVQFYNVPFLTEDRKEIDNMICADIYRSYCINPPISGPAFGYGGPWNKLVRRQMLVDCHITFDIRVKGVFDDILYSAHILANAQKVRYIQYPMYYYRQLEGSITHSFKPDIFEINSAIFNSWKEFIVKYDTNHMFLKPFYACVIRRIDESMKLYFVNEKNMKDKSSIKHEFREMITSEPYASAIRNVEINKLSKKQKLIVISCRLKLTLILWKIYR